MTLDDIYLVTPPDRPGPVYAALEESLRVHVCIRIYTGKTKVWNRADVRPNVCDVLERIAQATDPSPPINRASRCWAHLWATRTLSEIS